MKMNPLYKRVMALLVVLGPAYWLIMTEDGQRRSDAFMLQLFGKEVIDFNLAELDNRVTRDDLTKTVFTEVPWQCQDKTTEFGNRLCAGELGAFNGIPAHYITLYFVGDRINAMKVVYRNRYHEQMLSQLRHLLGTPTGAPASAGTQPQPNGVVEWRTEHGMVVMQEVLNDSEEAAVLWLAAG